jgi:hypothetical protein
MTAYNRNTLLVGILAAGLIGGVLSYFASPAPDGLEKGQEEMGAAAPAHEAPAPPPSPFDGYNLKWLPGGFLSNAVAGVMGSLVVLGILLGVGRLLRRPRRAAAPGGGDLSPGR